MRDSPICTFDVEVIRDSGLALLVVVEGDVEAWIPHSLIDEASEVAEDGDSGLLVIPEWLAVEKGLA